MRCPINLLVIEQILWNYVQRGMAIDRCLIFCLTFVVSVYICQIQQFIHPALNPLSLQWVVKWTEVEITVNDIFAKDCPPENDQGVQMDIFFKSIRTSKLLNRTNHDENHSFHRCGVSDMNRFLDNTFFMCRRLNQSHYDMKHQILNNKFKSNIHFILHYPWLLPNDWLTLFDEYELQSIISWH